MPPTTAVPIVMERNRGVNDPGSRDERWPRTCFGVVHATVPGVHVGVVGVAYCGLF